MNYCFFLRVFACLDINNAICHFLSDLICIGKMLNGVNVNAEKRIEFIESLGVVQATILKQYLGGKSQKEK